MFDISKELKRAQTELRAGSMHRAAEILCGIEQALLNMLEEAAPGSDADLSSRHALVKVLNNMGVVQKNLGDLDAAIDALEKSLRHTEGLGDEGIRMRTAILSNLGLVYSRSRKYTKSLEVFDQALKLTKAHPDLVESDLKVKIHNNRALFFVRFSEPDRAREELSLALESSRQNENDIGNEIEREAWLNANLALIHVEIGDEDIIDPTRQEEFYRLARSMFLKSAELYGNQGYVHHRLKQLVNAAEIELRLGVIEDATERLKAVRMEAEKLKAGRLLCDIAQVEIEVAMKTARSSDLDKSIREAATAFRMHQPPDISSRIARIESILRRGGEKTAIKLLSQFMENDSPGNKSSGQT